MKHNSDIFYNASCQDIAFDDYLLLGGGTDINPALYGEKRSPFTQSPDNHRDAENIRQINKYAEMGKPVIGICRGLQLLDAVNGGKLIQHTTGVGSLARVTVLTQPETWSFDGEIDVVYDDIDDECSACHHQMVDSYSTTGIVIGESYNDNGIRCFDQRGDLSHTVYMLPEIIYWPEKKHLAVQFHPEWHDPDHKMNEYLRGVIKQLFGLENVL